MIRNLEEYYDNDLLLEVKGILNGSSNYILSRVFDHGEAYADALRKAQELGFAEADPSFDILGYDSLFKLVIITVHALGVYVSPDDVFTYGISTLTDFDIRFAREKDENKARGASGEDCRRPFHSLRDARIRGSAEIHLQC